MMSIGNVRDLLSISGLLMAVLTRFKWVSLIKVLSDSDSV